MSTAEGALQQQIEHLYANHHGWLRGWLRRRLGNSFDAADLAHDTFLRLLVSGRAPTPEQSRAHLTQIAKAWWWTCTAAASSRPPISMP